MLYEGCGGLSDVLNATSKLFDPQEIVYTYRTAKYDMSLKVVSNRMCSLTLSLAVISFCWLFRSSLVVCVSFTATAMNCSRVGFDSKLLTISNSDWD
jgi:hypothetical protein